MSLSIRKTGRAGRITLQREKALNAVTWEMIREISSILPIWAEDDSIDVVVIDAEGTRAFSAGGDIAEIYAALIAEDFETPRRFWREEYQMNAMLFHFPKPVVSFMQGFTMGGGVGVGCHASHRIVGITSRIAMPECSIGLVPDIGGSYLLAQAPGHVGEYLGTTATRMGPGDAVFAGFADLFIPEAEWPDLIETLESTGAVDALSDAAQAPPASDLAKQQAQIERFFSGDTLRDILSELQASDTAWSRAAQKALAPNAPLAMAAAIELIHRARAFNTIAPALLQEYRFVHRIVAQGDFREGIRAAIIDKDKAPKWSHDSLSGPAHSEVLTMLEPLGDDDWSWERRT
ncbi:MAG: enoyl-CoA hydratase/isomerase family protein [Silicimonas sp.]|nr:enoyl-CoA hydratase/isomerase family protein [Silicimonas sp.]